MSLTNLYNYTISDRFSLCHYFPNVKDFTRRALVYSATGCLANTTLFSVPICMLNALSVSCANRITEEDEVSFKKVVGIFFSLAISTLFIEKVAAPLIGRASHIVTREFAIKLAWMNLFGEALLFSLSLLEKLSAPQFPESLEQIEKLSSPELLYIRNHFKDYSEMTEEVFDKYVKKLEEMNKNEVFPKSPRTVEEIERLDPFDVRLAHAFPDASNLWIKAAAQGSAEEIHLWEALHNRFYEQGLPLPYKDTVEGLFREFQGFHVIKISSLPQLQEVKAFSTNKLSWLYCHFEYNPEDFASYSLNDQVALNELFANQFERTLHYKPNTSNIVGMSDESAKKLYAYFKQVRDTKQACRFLILSTELKKAINERFTQIEELTTTLLDTIVTIPKLEEIKRYHDTNLWLTQPINGLFNREDFKLEMIKSFFIGSICQRNMPRVHNMPCVHSVKITLKDGRVLPFQGLNRDVIFLLAKKLNKTLIFGYSPSHFQTRRFSPISFKKMFAVLKNIELGLWHVYFNNNSTEWEKLGGERQKAFNDVFRKNKFVEVPLTF